MKPPKYFPSFFSNLLERLGHLTVAITIFAGGSVLAQDTWDGGGADADWATGANWVDNTAPSSGVLNFSGVTRTTTNNNISANSNFGAINFTNTGIAGETGEFILNGNAVTLVGNITSTGIVAGGQALTSTINFNLILNGNRSIQTNGGVSINVLHNITINGDISETGGARSLTKGGSGTSGNLTLGGNNTYTGNTNVLNGTVFFDKIADSGASNLGYGNLQLGNGGSGGGITYLGSGSTTARTLQVGAGASGASTGGGSISASGSNGGTGLKFTAANFTTTQAGTTVSSRLLTLGGTNTDDNTISGVIADINGATTIQRITKAGTGRWILSNTGSTYTGATTISEGVLQVAKLSNGGDASSIGQSTSAAANLVFNNGGTLRYSGSGDSTDRRMTFNSSSNSTGWAIESSGSGALNFTNTSFVAFSGSFDQARFFTLGGSNNGVNTFASQLVNNGTGVLSVTKAGSTTWALTNNTSTFTGTTFIQDGVLRVNKLANAADASSLGISGLIAPGRGNTTGTLEYVGAGDSTDRQIRIGTPNSVQGTGGATILNNGGGAITFTSSTFNAAVTGLTGPAGSQNRTLTLGGSYTGAPNTIQGAIVNNTASVGLVEVAKTGDSTWIIASNSNTYTGKTDVNAGKLIINGNISTSSLTTVASGATIGGDGATGALAINSGGFITPGNSAGSLDVVGNYVQAGKYTAEINGLVAGTQYDQINVTGTVNITGGSLETIFTGSYSLGDIIFILTNDSSDAIIGTYAGLAQGAVASTHGGFNWEISYLANSAANTFTGGNDIALRAVIPEPGAILLGGLGLLALLRRRRP